MQPQVQNQTCVRRQEDIAAELPIENHSDLTQEIWIKLAGPAKTEEMPGRGINSECRSVNPYGHNNGMQH